MVPVIHLDVDTWLQWVGAFGTIAAVLIAWLVHYEGQKTQRLLVRPFLNCRTFAGAGQFRIEVHNAGQAVAIVSRLRFLVDGKEVPFTEKQSETALWRKVLALAGDDGSQANIEQAHTIVGESALGSGDDIIIVSIKFPASTPAQEILQLRDRVEIHLLYRSTLGEKWEIFSQH